MACFKITWNFVNICFSIFAVVFAFDPHSLPLQVLSLSLFAVHLLFTITLNALTSKDQSESIHTFECYMLLENCIILLLTALLLIFTANSHLLFYALPFLCYISLLHIVCLLVACLNKNGYRFLQVFCQKKCCWRRCECAQERASLKHKSSKMERCWTMMITCSCCCKPKPKLKKRSTTLRLKEQLKKNLPRSSISSKGSAMSILSQLKRKSRKRSSKSISSIKSKKHSRSTSQQSVSKINLITPDRREKRLQDLDKVSPEKSFQIDSSFTTLPMRGQEPGSISSLNLVEGGAHYSQAHDIESPKKYEDKKSSLIECSICEKPILKECQVAVIPQCKHIFHAHCARLHSKEKGQRVCASCDMQYTIIWYAVSRT